MAELTLPNVVVAGIGRSGTTAIFQYLVEHPDVCGSKKKETSYFIDAVYEVPLGPIDSYAALFDHHGNEGVVVEATPSYFSGGRVVAEAIDAALGPDVKIVVSLRDPVTRFVSSYNLYLSRLWIEPGTTLEEYASLCEESPNIRESHDESVQKYQGYHGGFYADVLPEWFAVFGDRLKIVFFEDLQADTSAFMAEIAVWIGIDPTFFETRSFVIQNPTVRFRFQYAHRLANALNDRAEYWLRRRPALKNALRKVYARVNGTPASPAGDDSVTRERLRVAYADSNRRTRAILEAHGCTRFPAWLSTPG